MRAWYYAANGEETGPIPETDLAQLFAQERLRQSTLVWTEGLEEWEPASKFEIFSIPDARDEEEVWEQDWSDAEEKSEETEWIPPSKSAKKEKPFVGNETIRPWARFFARKIDIALLYMGLDFLHADFGIPYYHTPLYQGAFLVLGFLCLEPLLLVAFGATPGKLVLGLQLHARGGGSITYSMACSRTLKVWMRGLAFGLPLLNVFAQLKSLSDLNRHGETSWDREEKMVMEYMDFRLWRVVLTAIVVMALGVISASVGLR